MKKSTILLAMLLAAGPLYAAQPIPRPPGDAPAVVTWEFIRDQDAMARRSLLEGLFGGKLGSQEAWAFRDSIPSVLDTTDCREIPGEKGQGCVEALESAEKAKLLALITRIQGDIGARLLACAQTRQPNIPCYEAAIHAIDQVLAGLDHLWSAMYYFPRMDGLTSTGYPRHGTVSSRYLDKWFRTLMIDRLSLLRQETEFRRNGAAAALKLTRTYQSGKLIIFF